MRGVVVLLVACGSNGSPMPPPVVNACVADADCVISCATRDACCHDPYCETVQTASAAHDAEAYNAQHCAAHPSCPVLVDRPEPAYTVEPHCKAGACIADHVPRDAERVDLTGYDRACKTADDCRAVTDRPCDKCGCPAQAIGAGEMPRFSKARDAIVCAPDERQCGECKPATLACEAGKCVAK